MQAHKFMRALEWIYWICFSTKSQSTLFSITVKCISEALSCTRNSYHLTHQQNHRTGGLWGPPNYILKPLFTLSKLTHAAFVTLEIAKEITTVLVLLLLVCNGVGWVQHVRKRGIWKILPGVIKLLWEWIPKVRAASLLHYQKDNSSYSC